MQVDSEKVGPSPSRFVAGLFTDHTAICDAVADLHDLGLGSERIAIALSREGKRAQLSGANPLPLQGPLPKSEHTWMWRLRHAIDNDSHHHRMGLTSDDKAGQHQAALCTEVDLAATLSSFGVAEDRIWLLDEEIGPKGALMIVDAGEQSLKVRSLIERNCGLICTGMALESRGPASEEADAAAPPETHSPNGPFTPASISAVIHPHHQT